MKKTIFTMLTALLFVSGAWGTTATVGITTTGSTTQNNTNTARTINGATNLTVTHQLVSTTSGALSAYTSSDKAVYYGSGASLYSKGGYKWNTNTSSTEIVTANNWVGFQVVVANGYKYSLSNLSFQLAGSANFTYKLVIAKSDGTVLYNGTEASVTNYNKSNSTNHEQSISLSANEDVQNLTGTFLVKAYFKFGGSGKYFYLPAFTITGDVESLSTYSVTYKPNGGTGAEYEDATASFVASNTFTAPDGMTFLNWNTKADGSETAYEPGDAVLSNLILHAQWGYTVAYVLNGGSGDAPTQAATKAGGKFNLAAAPSRDCYTFTGWLCNIGGTYAAGAEYTMTAATTTFTAQWDPVYSSSADLTTSEVVSDKPNVNTLLGNSNIVSSINTTKGAYEFTSNETKKGYYGYKVKAENDYITILVEQGKQVKVLFGSIDNDPTIKVNGTDESLDAVRQKGDNVENTFTYLADDADALVKIQFGSGTSTLKTITIAAPDTRSTSSIAFSETSGSADMGVSVSYVLPALTKTPNSAVVTYSSSVPAVASVNETTGAVTLKKPGTTIITASFAGDEDYKPGSGTYTLTVTSSVYSTKYSWEGKAGGATQLGGSIAGYSAEADLTETDASSINAAAGSYYSIRLKGKTDFSTNVVKVTLNDALKAGDVIKVTACRNKDTAGQLSGFKAKFNVGSSSVSSSTGEEFVNINAAVSESAEYSTTPNTCTFDVPADAVGATIITMTRSHANTNLWITKLEVVSPFQTVSISSATWATFSCATEVAIPDGVTAYYANKKDASTITLKEITDGIIPANEGVVIHGDAGNYSAYFTATSKPNIGGNLLKPWTTSGTPTPGGTYYTLGVDGDNNPVFKESTGGTLAAGKAYLYDPMLLAPMVRFVFDEENTATEIHNIEDSEKAVKFIQDGKFFIMKNGVVYDALGRVVR